MMFSFLSERVQFKKKMWNSITSIKTLFKKVQENMKTAKKAKKAKSLAKERSLPKKKQKA